MSETFFITHDWPRAISHVDGDAFFTSCEEAIHAELRGKPIITGGERGIVAGASYAAKALGIKRGVTLHEAKQICRNSSSSLRLRDLQSLLRANVQHHSPFHPPGGGILHRRGHRRPDRDAAGAPASYETTALKIQGEIARELGITVSVGLSTTKVLAKDCLQTPETLRLHGHPYPAIPSALDRLPVEKVWGIGPAQIGAKGLRPLVGSGEREQEIG